MNTNFSLVPFQVSRPHAVPAGAIVTVTPAAGATAKVEYTKGSQADIVNGVAAWAPWAKGSITAATSDLVAQPAFIRVTAMGGAVAVSINPNPTAAESGAVAAADWGTPGGLQLATDSAGNPTGILDPKSGATIPFGGSSSSAPASWRLAATKNAPGGGAYTAYKSLMGYSVHMATDTLSQIKLVMSNWNYSASSESSIAGTINTRATIEYPIGSTPQRFFWGGSDTGGIPSGADLESDILTLAAKIPAGDFFALRIYQTCAAGLLISGNQDTAAGDRLTYTSGTTADLTDGGVVGNTDTVSTRFPAAILSLTTTPAVGCVGDSRFAGVNDSGNYPASRMGVNGEVARSLNPWIPFVNFGSPGMTPVQFTTANVATKRVAFVNKYCSSVICGLGINSLTSAASQYPKLQAIWALFPKLKVFQTTLPPSNTSTDYWTTLAGQSTGNVERVKVNEMIRAQDDISGGIFDICPAVESGVNSGMWKVADNARIVSDGAITAGTNTFTSATAAFTADDTGYKIVIAGAGASGAALTAVMTYVNATTVTLLTMTGTTQNASTTVSAAAGYIRAARYTGDGLHEERYANLKIARSNTIVPGMFK